MFFFNNNKKNHFFYCSSTCIESDVEPETVICLAEASDKSASAKEASVIMVQIKRINKYIRGQFFVISGYDVVVQPIFSVGETG